jgi:hypothetical protein
MMRFLLSALLFTTAIPYAADTPDLANIRKLAASMLKRKDLGGPGSFCEHADKSQTNTCSGPDRNEVRSIIRRDGTIESHHYRSPRESGDAIGFYRGKAPKEKWSELLRKIAAMHWKDEPGMSGQRPPPGPTENIQVFTLSDGMKSATYSLAGPAPSPIEEALYMPGILAMEATDTVWEVSISHPKIVPRHGKLEFTGNWMLKGIPSVQILFPSSPDARSCGRAGLRWYLDTSETSVDWQYADASRAKGKSVEWTVTKDNPALFQLSFPYAAPNIKGRKTAMLNGLGVLVVPMPGSDTIPMTFFSDTTGF